MKIEKQQQQQQHSHYLNVKCSEEKKPTGLMEHQSCISGMFAKK